MALVNMLPVGLIVGVLSMNVQAMANGEAQTLRDLMMTDDETQNWVDIHRHHTKRQLNQMAHRMDRWFGKTDPDNPARASLRAMTDVHWSEYENASVKFRVRGKLRLPTLENRLSVVFGDEELESEGHGVINHDGHIFLADDHDMKQKRDKNSSFGLRWSKLQKDTGVDTDIDLGVHSDDVFVRLRAEKEWQVRPDIKVRFDQMYRYGSRSEHSAASTLQFIHPQSPTRTLINRTHVAYTHKHTEDVHWSDSIYQQHHWQGRHGVRELNYGMYFGGSIENKKADLNAYGPYVSYRQPVWREWLFLQADVSYYNDKSLRRDHHLGAFGRVELVF